MVENKDNIKVGYTILEKRFSKIYVLLVVFYSIAGIYLLNTPINEWVFNLGQYNAQLLEVFPKAQYWINISVAYREKMIPLYVLYQGIFWFVFITVVGVIVKDWEWYKKNSIYRVRPQARHRVWLLFFMIIFFMLLLYAETFDLSSGSDVYMVYEELDKTGTHNDLFKWNQMNFLIYRAFGILSPAFCLFPLIVSIAGFISAFKQKYMTGEM